MPSIAAPDERIWRRLAAALLIFCIGGCSFQGIGTIDQHFQTFAARTPENNRIFVCSAYGCRTQTPFTFTRADIAKLQSQMAAAKNGGGPAEERRSIGRTLAWMERRVGDVVGTSADRPGDDFLGAGDPTQMDCVDVATNLSSYLLVLEHNKLLRHHTVGTVFVKEDWRLGWSGWPHYAAIIIDKQSQQRFAVDGWKLASGEEPEIVETEKWYIDDADIALKVPF